MAYAVGSGPYDMATADFNGDGYQDLAVVNDSVNTISVLLGNGDGTFQAQKTSALATKWNSWPPEI